MSPTNPRRRSLGFTLVEVVVIAPILILVLGGFVVAIVTMVGDAMASRDTSALTYDTQTALDRIEQDARVSTGFLATSGTLPSPQGSDSNYAGTAAFVPTATNNLVLNTLSTTTNPFNPARQVVYFANQPNACGSTLQIYNTPLNTQVIYFVSGGTLWRRTVVSSYTMTTGQSNTVCAQPWQQNSCSPGITNAQCQTQDVRLMDNVGSISISYYGDPTSTTDLGPSGAAAATTIGVTINAQKTSAGQPISYSASARMSRLNVLQ